MTDDQLLQLRADDLFHDVQLVVPVAFQHNNLGHFDGLGPLILVRPTAGEDLGIDDDALDTRRHPQRGIFHIAGLLAENSPQQLFFRG